MMTLMMIVLAINGGLYLGTILYSAYTTASSSGLLDLLGKIQQILT